MDGVETAEWEYEEEEEEAFEEEAELAEAFYDESEEDYGEFFPESRRRRRQRWRSRRRPPYSAGAKGVRHAIVKRPDGAEARIALPSRVPTVDEFRKALDKVQQDVQRQGDRIRNIADWAVRSQRRTGRVAQADVAASRNQLLILGLEQVKTVALEYAALSDLKEIMAKKNAGGVA